MTAGTDRSMTFPRTNDAWDWALSENTQKAISEAIKERTGKDADWGVEVVHQTIAGPAVPRIVLFDIGSCNAEYICTVVRDVFPLADYEVVVRDGAIHKQIKNLIRISENEKQLLEETRQNYMQCTVERDGALEKLGKAQAKATTLKNQNRELNAAVDDMARAVTRVSSAYYSGNHQPDNVMNQMSQILGQGMGKLKEEDWEGDSVSKGE